MNAETAAIATQAPNGTDTIAVGDEALRAKAYNLYLNKGLLPEEVGIELAVSPHLVRKWVKKGGWLARRIAIEQDQMSRTDSEYRQFYRDNMLKVVQANLELARSLQEQVRSFIETQLEAAKAPDAKPMRPGDLERLAKAAASATALAERAMGISDSNIQRIIEGGSRPQTGGPPKGTPLLIVDARQPVAPVSQIEKQPEPIATDVTRWVTVQDAGASAPTEGAEGHEG